VWLRLPLAAAVVAWGARTDRAWTVPVAVTLGLPVLWPSGFAVLAALPCVAALQGTVIQPRRAAATAAPATAAATAAVVFP
jgi:hypothetical protein